MDEQEKLNMDAEARFGEPEEAAFWVPKSLDDLAEERQVSAITDMTALTAAWPADELIEEDPLGDVLDDRKARRRVAAAKAAERSAQVLFCLLAGFFIAVSLPSPVHSQVKRCQCEFADPQWQAYGTKSPCSIWMDEGRKSCEIEFGGLGADPDMIAKILGREPSEYYAEVSEIVRAYLELRGKRDLALTSPEFIQKALPALMRGAFLRGIPAEEPMEDWKNLNAAIETYFKEFSVETSEIFRGSKDPMDRRSEDFEIPIPGVLFHTETGVVVVELKGKKVSGTLVTVFSPQE